MIFSKASQTILFFTLTSFSAFSGKDQPSVQQKINLLHSEKNNCKETAGTCQKSESSESKPSESIPKNQSLWQHDPSCIDNLQADAQGNKALSLLNTVSANILSVIASFAMPQDLIHWAGVNRTFFKKISRLTHPKMDGQTVRERCVKGDLGLFWHRLLSESSCYFAQSPTWSIQEGLGRKVDDLLLEKIFTPNVQLHSDLGFSLLEPVAQVLPLVLRLSPAMYKKIAERFPGWQKIAQQKNIFFIVDHCFLLKDKELLDQVIRCRIDLSQLEDEDLSWVVPLVKEKKMPISFLLNHADLLKKSNLDLIKEIFETGQVSELAVQEVQDSEVCLDYPDWKVWLDQLPYLHHIRSFYGFISSKMMVSDANENRLSDDQSLSFFFQEASQKMPNLKSLCLIFNCQHQEKPLCLDPKIKDCAFKDLQQLYMGGDLRAYFDLKSSMTTEAVLPALFWHLFPKNLQYLDYSEQCYDFTIDDIMPCLRYFHDLKGIRPVIDGTQGSFEAFNAFFETLLKHKNLEFFGLFLEHNDSSDSIICCRSSRLDAHEDGQSPPTEGILHSKLGLLASHILHFSSLKVLDLKLIDWKLSISMEIFLQSVALHPSIKTLNLRSIHPEGLADFIKNTLIFLPSHMVVNLNDVHTFFKSDNKSDETYLAELKVLAEMPEALSRLKICSLNLEEYLKKFQE